jgi:lipopolysaccharide biosynthesis regulator YciM
MLLGHVYARKGDPAMARRMLRELQGDRRYVPAIYLAAIYSGLGDREAALESLKKAVAERCEYLIYLPRDPMADAFRRQAGFEGLLKPATAGR